MGPANDWLLLRAVDSGRLAQLVLFQARLTLLTLILQRTG